MSRPARLLALIPALALAVGLTAPAGATTSTEGLETQLSFPTRTVTDAAGNTLLADRYGRALQLHGANLGKTGDITEKGVADMAAAGLTLLRYPIQWRKVEPTQGDYDEAYVEHLKEVLGWAETYGVLVMIDWHQDVFGPYFGENFGFDGIPAWATRTDGIEFERVPGNWFNSYWHPAVQAAFTHLWNDADLQQAQVDAWTYLADQLEGSPALLGYDLFNEPMIKSEALLGEMYNRVIAGIRTVDQRSWLWVEPTVLVGEGLPTMLPGFDDPREGADRIGYAPHAYSTSVEEGGDWDTSSSFVTTYEAAITQYPRKHDMPVIVGEWGPASAGATFPGNVQLVKQQIASFARFASGWAVWYACVNETGGGYCIFSDDDGHLDEDRGAAWRPYPLTLAGSTVREKATKDGWTLVYRPRKSAAGSQIVVPGGFADRISVKVSDGVTKTVSAPTRTGARTVTLTGPVRKHPTWTITISPR